MKVISLNANGIRAAARKGFFGWMSRQKADVVCLQETRAHPDQITDRIYHPRRYHNVYHPAERRGYSGVATLSKAEPAAVKAGLGVEEYDVEGRVLVTEHPGFKLFNVYFPNGGRKLEQLSI